MKGLLERPGALLRTGLALAAGVSMITMISADRAEAAPTITINSVVGTWISATPVGLASLNGLGTNQLRWGNPSGQPNQSGYDFVGVAPPPQVNIPAETPFNLGTFTHHNFPISAGTSITGAVLEVAFNFDWVDGSNSGSLTNFTSTYVFDHWETDNGANPCADGGANGSPPNQNGCADRVKALINPSESDKIEVGGLIYYLNVTGFDVGSEFWTTEGLTNKATLRGSFTTSVIPLPAAAWLLIGGLGALGAVGRKRRAAA